MNVKIVICFNFTIFMSKRLLTEYRILGKAKHIVHSSQEPVSSYSALNQQRFIH